MVIPIGPQVWKVSPNLHFQVILQVDLRWPLTLNCDLWPHEHMKVPYYINKLSLVQIGLQLFKWGHFFTFSAYLTTWPQMTFDYMNIWRFTYYINKLSLVQIGLQLFKRSHFHIFSLSYNLTSDDLWPSYMIFDLINKWGFPCCIYDPTLFEIHRSMWKIEPNVNPFSQQKTTDNNNNRQQGTKWSLCVFPAKAGDTKRYLLVHFTKDLPYHLIQSQTTLFTLKTHFKSEKAAILSEDKQLTYS